ncbi:MAG: M48 family metalloprotease [Longimonas sp.]|uniref:M48 family metalloprotease n=1 Tax=Longimonas sp. TaxID=2039626 RepID=UPI003359A203
MRNFFERQDEARRNTKRLIILFVVAVIGLVIAGYGVAILTLLFLAEGGVSLWNPGLFFVIVVGTALIVGGGSLFKISQLKQGGHVVAEALGGQPLGAHPSNYDEQQLRNIVEEMAIASGVPAPQVYILEEEGINAFAAGYTVDDAVIGVTRGCMQALNRAELQGVIAHEYSHILNGDMRLNIRLMGVLNGILLIAILGRTLLRATFYSSMGRRRSDDNKSQLVMIAAGVGLLVVGSVGLLCGRLIKSAVSRQREFLADAAAVQFTRNPKGIGGALKKIAGYDAGSKIEHPKAEESSHLFFSDGVASKLFGGGAFATHPPLDERIRRIDSEFDAERASGSSSQDAAGRRASGAAQAAGASGFAAGAAAGAAAARSASSGSPSADEVVSRAGELTADDIDFGAKLRNALPDDLLDAAHDPLSATAIIYALLLDPDEKSDGRAAQMKVLREHVSKAEREETERLLDDVHALPHRLRLPIVNIAAPALRELSSDQHATIHDTVQALVRADDQLTVFEYALESIIRHRLDHIAHPADERPRFKQFSQIQDDAIAVLSMIAQAGASKNRDAATAFRAGLGAFEAVTDPSQYRRVSARPERLDEALDRLAQTYPALKEQVIDACARCVLSDDTVTDAEADLLMAVAEALACPIPPFVLQSDAISSS